MSKPFGRPFRGEYDNSPTAGAATPITLFDYDGNVLTLAADERLDVTDVSYRSTAATNLRVFFDNIGDGSQNQSASPTLSNSAAGTTINAGTYFYYYTYYDPFTKTETVRSTSQSIVVLTGDKVTVTAPQPIPAYMKDNAGNLGYIKVYLAGTGLVGQSPAGTAVAVVTSHTAQTAETSTSGGSASGKAIGGALLPANGIWSDCFETGKIGPPGVLPKLISSVSTPIIVHLSGRIIRNIQLP